MDIPNSGKLLELSFLNTGTFTRTIRGFTNLYQHHARAGSWSSHTLFIRASCITGRHSCNVRAVRAQFNFLVEVFFGILHVRISLGWIIRVAVDIFRAVAFTFPCSRKYFRILSFWFRDIRSIIVEKNTDEDGKGWTGKWIGKEIFLPSNITTIILHGNVQCRRYPMVSY